MVAQHYRWDFIGLSTDTKPTPDTSEKVTDGSTFYCSDTSKLYIWCKNNWYERKALGGGGGGGGTDSPIKVLTDADANFTFDETDYIAVWLLDGGIYTLAEDATVSLLIYVEYGDDPTVVETTGDEFTSSERPLFLSNNDLEDTLISPEISVYSTSSNACYSITKDGVLNDVVNYSVVFTGTNGNDDGLIGLVPAPEVTDVDKFLCSDGSWQTVGGGGSLGHELTTDDYNWNTTTNTTENPNAVAIWLLPPGIYTKSDGSTVVVCVSRGNIWGASGFIVLETNGDKVTIICSNTDLGKDLRVFRVVVSTGYQQSGLSGQIALT